MHSYLLQPASWEASGVFVDQTGRETPVAGEARIVHTPEVWILTANLGEIENRYEIKPMKAGSLSTAWRSFNPALGELLGHFAFVDDAIISTFFSNNGEYTGSEFLLQISPTEYQNRGVLYRAGEFVSSWILDLEMS